MIWFVLRICITAKIKLFLLSIKINSFLRNKQQAKEEKKTFTNTNTISNNRFILLIKYVNIEWCPQEYARNYVVRWLIKKSFFVKINRYRILEKGSAYLLCLRLWRQFCYSIYLFIYLFVWYVGREWCSSGNLSLHLSFIYIKRLPILFTNTDCRWKFNSWL